MSSFLAIKIVQILSLQFILDFLVRARCLLYCRLLLGVFKQSFCLWQKICEMDLIDTNRTANTTAEFVKDI